MPIVRSREDAEFVRDKWNEAHIKEFHVWVKEELGKWWLHHDPDFNRIAREYEESEMELDAFISGMYAERDARIAELEARLLETTDLLSRMTEQLAAYQAEQR